MKITDSFSLLLLLTATSLLPTTTTHAQCAIYVNQKTGAMGWAYNSRNEHYTLDEIFKLAEKECEEHTGGYNCELMYRSNKENGWCCAIRGYSGGLYCFGGSCGNHTEQEAIKNAKKNFTEKFGSIEYEKWTWYVY